MSSFEQVPFDAAQFADNPEPRCPCLLLLDTSGSMQGEPIAQLNEGLAAFKEALLSDSLATKRVEIGVISFGPVQIISEFVSPDLFQPPTLSASGDTPMGQAIIQGIEMVRQRKEVYKANGIAYYRPWIWLLSDGEPTDSCKRAAEMVREGEQKKAFQFFAVGSEGANLDVLGQIATRKPLKLKEVRYRDMFVWLSNSMSSVSKSQPGEAVQLVNPVTPDGWGSAG